MQCRLNGFSVFLDALTPNTFVLLVSDLGYGNIYNLNITETAAIQYNIEGARERFSSLVAL
jgi:hypothetical protein